MIGLFQGKNAGESRFGSEIQAGAALLDSLFSLCYVG